MKKILYLVSTLGSSGPTNQLSYIIQHLDRKIFEPTILTLSDEPELSSIDYFKNVLKVHIDSLRLSRIQSMINGSTRVKKYILDNKIDLVHSQGFRADGLIRRISIPHICSLRTIPFRDYLTKFGKTKGLLIAYSHMQIINSNNQNYIACSKSIKEEFDSKGISMEFIQNGVDTKKYSPLEQTNRDQLKKKLKLDLNKKFFITVGSLIPRKDVKTVIKAFQLSNTKKNSILLIAGDGFEINKLKIIADESVLFLGNVSNILEYLQISDFFVSASLSEGLPNTVLEAMACGLPVILSNIPSHRELCIDDNIFFQIYDFHELSQKMITIDKKKNNTTSFNKKFTAEFMSEQYQKLYLEKIE